MTHKVPEKPVLKQRLAGKPVAASRREPQPVTQSVAQSAAQSITQSTTKTERQAATARSATLLREILDYQERLNRLSVRSASDEDYLISAYRRQIEARQNQLNALSKPLAVTADTWHRVD